MDVWSAREKHQVLRTASLVLFHIYTGIESALTTFLQGAGECTTAVALLSLHTQFMTECEDCMSEASWGCLDNIARATSKDWKKCFELLTQQLRNDASHTQSHALWTSLQFNNTRTL